MIYTSLYYFPPLYVVFEICRVLGLNRYASVKAIETESHVDDQQWLTYWVLYSLITLFELSFAKVIEWYMTSTQLCCSLCFV